MESIGLDEEKLLILKDFRNLVQDVLKPHCDDRFLLKWLKARDFDVAKAEKMLREDVKFRKKMGSDTIVADYKMPQIYVDYQATAFLGFDNNGHSVRFYNIGAADFKGFMRCVKPMDNIKYFVHLLESDEQRMRENCKKTGKPVEKMTYIADFTGFRLRQFTDRAVIRMGIQMINYYQDHYPESLNVMYMINVPKLFHYVFTVFKPFLNEVVMSKMFFYGSDGWQKDVFSLVPMEIIPAYIGGKRYEPPGDPLCRELLNWNGKIPLSYYMADQGTLQVGDPGVRETVVKERSSFDLDFSIQKPGSTLCWEFQTKDYNIKFGLFYRKTSKIKKNDSYHVQNGSKDEMLPVENVESHEFSEKGEYLCRNAGIYTLHFDNTYSWFTSKRLLYKTEVKLPTETELQ